MENKVLNLLGLARRGGKIILGDSNLPLLAKPKKIFIIIASDASDNTKKKFSDKCTYYKKEYIVNFTKEELSSSLGIGNVSVIGLTDPNLIAKVQILLKEGDIYGTKQQ